MKVAGVVAAALAISCGCGGGDAAPLSPGEAQAACGDACAHAVSCAWESDLADCRTECADQSSLFRGDGYRAWLECVVAADCAADNPGEACYLEAAAGVGARAAHEDYADRCAAAQLACPLPGRVCEIVEVILFSDAYMRDQVLPCLDLSCDELSSCLETYVLDAF